MVNQCALALSAFLALGAPPNHAVPSQPQVSARETDSALADRIAHRLDDDARLWKYDIEVSVKEGVATVTGTVATAAQKAHAGRLAQVNGISRVDNKVTVDSDVDKTLMEKTKAGMTKTGEAISDTWITGKVKFHYVGEALLKDSNISVETNNQVVTLKGTVKSAAARARAVALAKQTDGVERVVDQLTIRDKHE